MEKDGAASREAGLRSWLISVLLWESFKPLMFICRTEGNKKKKTNGPPRVEGAVKLVENRKLNLALGIDVRLGPTALSSKSESGRDNQGPFKFSSLTANNSPFYSQPSGTPQNKTMRCVKPIQTPPQPSLWVGVLFCVCHPYHPVS